MHGERQSVRGYLHSIKRNEFSKEIQFNSLVQAGYPTDIEIHIGRILNLISFRVIWHNSRMNYSSGTWSTCIQSPLPLLINNPKKPTRRSRSERKFGKLEGGIVIGLYTEKNIAFVLTYCTFTENLRSLRVTDYVIRSEIIVIQIQKLSLLRGFKIGII